MKIAELAKRAGVAPRQCAGTSRWASSRPLRQANGYRDYDEVDLARLRLVISLRRLGLAPEDAGRLARLCLERVPSTSTSHRCSPGSARRRTPTCRPRPARGRAPRSRDDHRGRRPRGTEGACHVRRSDPRPVRVHAQLGAQPDRRGAAGAATAATDFEVHSAGTEVDAGQPVRRSRCSASSASTGAALGASAITEFLDQQFDYVITVCDRAAPPARSFRARRTRSTGASTIRPRSRGRDAEKLAAFRRTETEISARLRPFIEVALRAAGRPQRSGILG